MGFGFCKIIYRLIGTGIDIFGAGGCGFVGEISYRGLSVRENPGEICRSQ